MVSINNNSIIRSTPKKYIYYNVGFLLLFFGLWILGMTFNISVVALFAYVAYICFLLKTKRRFFVNFLWLFIMASLNIAGVFSCELSPQYINELRITTSYNCSLIPLIILYIVLFSSVELHSYKNLNSDKINFEGSIHIVENKTKTHNIVLLLGTIIAIILFSMVIDRPYFSIGLSRLEYAKTLTSWEKSLKTLLPMFIPSAMMCINNKRNKIRPVIFLVILFLYYFWTGDKFGNFLLTFYIIIMCNSQKISDKMIKRVLVWIGLFVIAIILVVYIQQFIINGVNDFSMFIVYLQQRLLGQGEVWWSVYEQSYNACPRLGEFYKELLAMFPFNNIPLEEYGQWKMMRVTDHYSPFSLARIKEGIPYTATTAASSYYYFGFLGSLFVYAIIGGFYGKLISSTINAVVQEKIIESMFCVKLILVMNNLLFASDLYICSYKGLIYLLALFIVKKYRFKIGMNKCI